MATKIKIGHASISENNSVNGTAGDSTGHEVWINPDFNITDLKPNVLLRPNTAALAKASAEACEAGCNNDNIGYSQSSRNTLYNLAKAWANNNADTYDLSKVGLCNTDCSAFLTVCAIAGGSRITYGSNAPTTSNMRTRFKQSGDYSVLTDSKHLTMTDYLKRGDILVCEGSHTVMVLENGSSVADDEESSEGGSTGITPITDIRVRYINVNIKDIEATKVTAGIKLIERKSGVADKALSKSIIDKCKWSYKLETLGKSGSKTKQLTSMTNKKEVTLTSLSAETTYTIQVIATNKDTGNVDFCSSKVLFTTLPEKETTNKTKKEFTAKALNAVDHIYIKTNNEFKPVIIYNNEV
jgi:hypothetical protein